MKTYLILAFLSIFLAFGCKEKEKKEIERLNKENLALKVQSQAKDSSINDILQSFHEIESNLAVIKEKESLISVESANNTEMTPDVKARINEDIKVIGELMAKNKKEIARLRRLLKESNLKIEQVEKLVGQLNIQIAERDSQIVVLKADLSKMNITVESLNASLDTLRRSKEELATTVEDRTNSLNTAYYLVGTKKDLLTGNVIAKSGGVIGINSSVKLKQDFNDSKFEKVDIRKIADISVNSKNPKLVTTHPAGTYQLERNEKGIVEKIKILNAEKFWSTSKYLVVML